MKWPNLWRSSLSTQNYKKCEIAKEMKLSSSTIQRYRREIKLLSPYRIPSSKTHIKKQKISNNTDRYLIRVPKVVLSTL